MLSNPHARPRHTRSALAIAMAMALSATTIAPALAQQADATAEDASKDEKAQTLDTVSVTGSHIRRVDMETASPVITIDRQRIEDSGKSTLGDLLQDMPVMAGYQANTSINSGFSHGRALVSLRGLGPERTLVLLDGHRMTGPASSVASAPGVDVNSIPASMVDHIEVLTSGASAIYGSDAIGGVVNIILKKGYDGFALEADGGISGHGDGARRNFGVEWGKTWDRGSLMLGLSHNSQNALYNSDRDFAQKQLNYVNGVIGSYTGSNGRAVLSDGSVVAANSNAGTGQLSASDYHTFGSAAGDRYNYYGTQYMATPVERTNFTARGTFDVTDSIEAYADVLWTHSKTISHLQPYGISASSVGADIADNPYNPFGADLSEYYLRTDLFTRKYVSSMAQTNIDAGLRGGFGDSSWKWDANFGYAKYVDKLVRYGFAVTSELTDVFNTANVFNVNDPSTIAALNASLLPVDLKDESTSKSFNLALNGTLFTLPAGDVQAAVGLEYRKNGFQQGTQASVAMADEYGACDYMDGCILAQGHEETLKEVYAELLVPILTDVPFAHSLTLDIGSRYSRYSAFGGTTNSSLALEWRPVEDLLIRGTAAQVFRAPALGDLYGSPYQGIYDAGTFYDPCEGYTGGAGAGGCTNVPTDGSFVNTGSATVIVTGDANAGFDLKPETGHSYDVGLVYDPEWLPGFSVNLDAWRVELSDMISGVDYTYVLDQCYQGNAQYCALVQRSSTGALVSVTVPYAINYDKVEIRGYDFGTKYQFEAGRWGKFQLGLDATIMDKYLVDGDSHNYVGETSGTGGNLPRLKANLTAGWDYHDWHAAWTMRYIGSSTVGSAYENYCYNTDAAGNCVYFKVNPVVYHNLSLSRKFEKLHLNASLGVDNVADKLPPIYYGYYSNASNTDASTYDTLGRYVWGKLRWEF
ncbi:Outer membrane receptor proteins, mostly Fe transport [Pseudoxanthomonas sp. GM95]|uniref:TonB-dependent receptor n=1 Tax=Pseudoxanthomonas sp. GM95 TaxID=1881043 RepID=UPI0008CAA1FF|nr:TonB-dependent receptor [Pseudoxanthomonas sp. GM95]SEL15589.1 Outer membrane receptor proteins, mostly Fe transport [Pseudoxanthomonas sp. GM95]